MVCETEILEIQKSGANARALSRNYLDNPYLKATALPATSGDSVGEWKAKHDAWALGWTIEDAMRG